MSTNKEIIKRNQKPKVSEVDKAFNKIKYKNKQRNARIKAMQYQKQHPKTEYVDFIIKNVARYFSIETIDILGPDQSEIFYFPRLIAVDIVNNNTKLRSQTMYFFNRDRSTFYNCEKRLPEILKIEMYNIAYEKLKKECMPENFENGKLSPEMKYNFDMLSAVKNQL